MGDFKNVFSYSGSRYGTFKRCKYQYYLKYYKSFGGWNYSRNSLEWQLWKLKLVYPLAPWIGIFVHEQVKKYINWYYAKEGVPIEKYLSFVDTEFEEAWSASEQGCFNDNKKAVIFEHQFGGTLDKQEVKNKIDIAINHFLNKYSHNLKSIPYDNVLTIDVDDFSQFIFIDGVKVFTIVDFAYFKEETKKIYIIDWKTGYSEDYDSDQLKLYALYYKYFFDEDDLGFKNFSLNQFNLTLGLYVPTKLKSDNDLLIVEKKIKKQINELREYLEDEEENIPVSEKKFIPSASLYNCKFCEYQEVCSYAEN